MQKLTDEQIQAALTAAPGWSITGGKIERQYQFPDFLRACDQNALPDYCFIEPNYTDHDDPNGGGEIIASDQHPDHDVRAGEQFIATVYNAIRAPAPNGK